PSIVCPEFIASAAQLNNHTPHLCFGIEFHVGVGIPAAGCGIANQTPVSFYHGVAEVVQVHIDSVHSCFRSHQICSVGFQCTVAVVVAPVYIPVGPCSE